MKVTSRNTLILELYGELMPVQVKELSCAQLEILRLRTEGSPSVARFMNNKDCKAWFSRDGFQFTVAPDGYSISGNLCTSRCGRIMDSVEDFIERISKPPYETPYLKEWGKLIFSALEPRYIKPMTGVNQAGKYLSKELLPADLDRIISSLVKRKILHF